MTPAELILNARSYIRHDVDSQATPAQYTRWLNQEQHKLRRLLNSAVPQLFTTFAANETITAPGVDLTKPADYDKMIKVEKLVGGTFYPVPSGDPYDSERTRGWVEYGPLIRIFPKQFAPGTYRITYNPLANLGAADVEVPAGLEDVLARRIAATALARFDEDPTFQYTIADKEYKEQLNALHDRYGVHTEPGLIREGTDWWWLDRVS